ncbi:MAG: Blue-light-activated protein [Syntrophorhabdus sp. PtaB.Bin047]|jgi:signal transduction histidine kinase/CheY-like chemotaxis protein|nr:MAG: Blue-light-activated protein [Syntrophorhabdus sp. PtaB.Bin047]
MSTSEELREALLDLEEARKKEALHRRMAEALLEGLHALVTSKDPNTMFTRLFDAMKEPLEFDSAFVLLQNHDGALVTLTTSSSVFAHRVWRPGAMLGRVLGGQPVAVFDTRLVEEWNTQPEEVLGAARSALHFSIRTTDRNAIMVCTHPDRARFSKNHVTLARRFSMLATQALQKLESDEKLADLEKQLETQASIAELNRRLAESEQKLSRAKKMEAVGLLAGGVAHDLNNILTGIVSYPDLLLMDEDMRPEYREAIETIRDAGLRAAAVVDDLLTVAKGAASPREPLNLNAVVDEYLLSPEHQRLFEADDGVVIETELGGDLLNIMGSPIHITKALMNLAYNAVEALQGTEGGRVLVRTENRYVDRPLKGYTEVRAGEYAVVSVRDNGSGISPEDLERIFEPFYTRKRMGRSGTGLGLTIVWNVMQDHGGYVDVTTGEGGTEFLLYFPAIREALADAPSFLRFDDYRGNGETVLVVDDLEDQRKTACAILRKLGYVPHSAESGEKALEYLSDHSVSIVLLDMIMEPGMNGMETYRRISAIHPGQKAVIASGYSMSEDVVAAQHMGAGIFIKKPYTIAKLGQALKEELTK